jgi:DNA primase
MIPDDVVDRVRDEADIIAIIGEYVKLKRVGNSFRGPCPFHHGKNDNFSVSPNGGYKCFVCGESGDVITFVRKHLGLDFVEAVKLVGAKAGIEVQDVAQRREEKDAREPLWEVNATAADFFRRQLWDMPEGKVARDYLESRGLSREDADRFGIGFAPVGAPTMRDALIALGFDADRQLEAGLLVKSEERPEPRPRFRNRLMFPIYDAAGHVVGFGGRALGDFEPKYLNSAESEVFSKSKLLYGMNWAKQAIRKADRLIVVEGYFDAIRLMLAGISEVVAPMGTALTDQQTALIRKYTKNVFLLYDSDQAGLKATFRSGDKLLESGVSVRVITLPDGEDPDTYVAKVGAEGFERAANASVDVFDRKIQILERGGWFADLRRKREAIDKLLPTIRVTADPLTRDLYIARTAEVSGVSRDIVEADLRNQQQRSRPAEETPWQPDEAPERRERAPDRRRATQPPPSVLMERELVRILLYNPVLIPDAASEVSAADLRVDEYRRIYTELVSGDEVPDLADVATRLDESSVGVMQQLMDFKRADLVEADQAEAVLRGVIGQLRALAARREAEQLQAELQNAAIDDKDNLLRRITNLQRDGVASGSRRWKQFTSHNH